MTNENTLSPSDTGMKKKRTGRLIALGLICVLAALGYGLYWLLIARFTVYTDNAYVQGNVVQITPLISATVVAIHVNDTDHVQAGQLLVDLNPQDVRLALDQADAQLAQTVREVRTLYAANNALTAIVNARQADLARSETDLLRLNADLGRREALAEGGAVSVEELQHLKNAITNAHSTQAAAVASLTEAKEQLVKNQTLTEDTRVENHPRVLAAAVKYREAWLNVKRAGIVAPLSGVVARRSAQVGQRVAIGVPIMAIVPLDQLWVDANFKESQLASLRIGQPATLTSDVYGQRVEYHGHVAGFGAGTGAVFSLLPAQNATGNWIKIVQRVPVRIALDAKELAEHPLRVGLSMEATVDIHDQSGPSSSSTTAVDEAGKQQVVTSTRVFDDLDKAVDERVNAIVSANLGHRVHLKRAD